MRARNCVVLPGVNVVYQTAGASHASTGIFGTKFLLSSLASLGVPEVAHEVLSQTTFPSYGYMLAMGATTLWEVWQWDTDTYSHNHGMYASVSEFFVKSVGGIAPLQNSVVR